MVGPRKSTYSRCERRRRSCSTRAGRHATAGESRISSTFILARPLFVMTTAMRLRPAAIAREPISNPVWIGLLDCLLLAAVGQPPRTLVLLQGTKPRFRQRRELGRIRPALPFNIDGFGRPVPCHDCSSGAVQENSVRRDTSPPIPQRSEPSPSSDPRQKGGGRLSRREAEDASPGPPCLS